MSGPHGAYILAAYAATAIVVTALILRAVAGYRVRRRRIEELEAGGARRRGTNG